MIYECSSEVLIRRESRIVEYIDPKSKKPVTNVVGKLTQGTIREIYSTITDSKGATWGRVSESDAAGIAEARRGVLIVVARVRVLVMLHDAPALLGIVRLRANVIGMEDPRGSGASVGVAGRGGSLISPGVLPACGACGPRDHGRAEGDREDPCQGAKM